MMIAYYWIHKIYQSTTWNYGPVEWEKGHMFDEPQKMTLFGDPSVIAGGAFNTYLSGNVYDGSGGPLNGFSRYRVTGDVTVPATQSLNAYPNSSILFEWGNKLVANGGSGFTATGTGANPVSVLSYSLKPLDKFAIAGMKVYGQMRMTGGGTIVVH
jgi:hypothetical protein